MNEWLQVIILGIVEGITEFLPISSTGHLIIGQALLDFPEHLSDTFAIFIQIGAVFAVLLYYWRDLIGQAKAIPTDAATRRFWLYILVAIIPAGGVGFLLRHWIKDVLFGPLPVAISLIIGGIVFLWVERRQKPQAEVTTDEVTQITLKQAIIIGLAQTVAMIPGVSRSGASIVGGMQAGLSRKAATTFSFYLAIPTLGGATLVELISSLEGINQNDLALLVVGAIISGIVAWFSIGWLLRFVSQNTFVAFGYYRIVIGLVLLVLVANQVI